MGRTEDKFPFEGDVAIELGDAFWRSKETSPQPSAAPDEHVVVDAATGGRKGQKLARFDLLPADVLWQLAEHYGRGAEKYEDRNWERGYDWSLSFAAMQRHAWAFWNGETYDAETGSHHMVAAMFHAAALVRFTRTHPAGDTRPSATG